MKKHFLSLFALLVLAHWSWAAAVTDPAAIPNYWSSVDNTAGAALFNAVSAATAVGYHSIGYDGLWSAYEKTDNRNGKIWDMYSNCEFAFSQHGSYKKECDRYNREHSIPQSWWGGGTGGVGNDIFHVVPTDGYVNNWRGNDPYGEVTSANKTSTNGCKSGSSKHKSCSGTVFEPADEYKGDLARGIMGALVKWKGNWTQGQGGTTFSGTFTAAGHFGFTAYAAELFMRWHREDPVSQKEIDRNNGIQQTQGNRNPFIDYPYLAEFIWGEHAGEELELALLMPSTDAEFIPGQSNGWRGGEAPEKPKFGVNWSVNGEIIQTDSVYQDKRVTELLPTPTSCSTESNIFVGWCPAPIEGSTDEAPAVIYTKASDIPAITADITLYAVFAHEESTEGGAPATYVYDADHKEGWTCTATMKSGSYWLLDEDKELVSPELDLSGLSSITAKLRTYGGASYCYMNVLANGAVIATLEATKGTTLAETTWNNDKTLSGKSALTFVSKTATSGKGVAFSSVTIDATGVSVERNRYITSCQDPSEIETVLDNKTAARKVMVGNNIYIQVGERLYSVTGQRVK